MKIAALETLVAEFEETKRQLAEIRALIFNRPILHRKDLMQRYGICESTLHRWRNRKRLPRPVYISGPRWRVIDLERAEEAGRLANVKGSDQAENDQ